MTQYTLFMIANNHSKSVYINLVVQSLVYTSVADCRRWSPTLFSLEQATTGAFAICRPNALEYFAGMNSLPTYQQTDGIQIQMRIHNRIQFLLTCIYTGK